jgi:hypothetical protein
LLLGDSSQDTNNVMKAFGQLVAEKALQDSICHRRMMLVEGCNSIIETFSGTGSGVVRSPLKICDREDDVGRASWWPEMAQKSRLEGRPVGKLSIKAVVIE